MITLPDNWIELAASHGVTGWIRNFIKTYLPQLKDQTISPEQFALHFADELDSRSLSTPAQQKNYRSNICQALKVLNLNHPAITLVSPTTKQYRELNEEQRGRLADRETKYFTSATAEVLVERATGLLSSAEWSDVGAGLAVLIGRRISEILLSDFSMKSAWSLNFSEMSKKADTDGLTIEIPTLAPADAVLSAIQRLQKALKIEDLKLGSLTPKMAKQTVNNRYSEFVATKCHEHFSDLVPARADGENLYSHIFRAVYATIAAHWFCPTNIPEHNFKAEIQGHFTLTKVGKKLPNYSARANYDDYEIGTKDGNRDGRLGIKLGLLPGLEVIEAFRKTQPQQETQTISTTATATELATTDEEFEQIWESLSDRSTEEDTSNATESMQTEPTELLVEEINPVSQPTEKEKAKTKRPELHADDLARMTEIMAKRGMVGSAAQLFHALIETFESGQVEQHQQQTQTIGEVANTLNWFTNEIQSLRTKVADLEQERDRLRAAQATTDELSRLQRENVQLKQELQDTQSRLEGIQRFLKGSSQPTLTSTNNSTVAHVPTATANSVTAIPAPATTPSTTAKTEAPVVRRNRGETAEKLNQIIDALISWNTSQEDSETQLRISIPTIKGLASAMGANYQPAIQEVLKQRSAELEEHHSHLLIGTRHNASVSRKDDVLQSITRDYLGLENWQEVKYQG